MPANRSRGRPATFRFTLAAIMHMVALSAIAVMTGKNLIAKLASDFHEVDRALNWGRFWWMEDLSWHWGAAFLALAAVASTILAPTAACIAYSLVYSAVVAIRERPVTRNDPLPRRCGWHFDWFGKLALAAVIGALLAIDHIFTPQQFGLWEPKSHLLPPPVQQLRSAVLLVAVLVALAWGQELPHQASPRRVGRWIVDVVSLPAAALLFLVICLNAVLLHSLVFIAVRGVENVAPNKFADPAMPQAWQRVPMFWNAACWGTLGAVACIAACWLLAAAWKTGWPLRVVAALLLVTGAALQIDFLVWAYPQGFQILSPAFAESLMPQQPHAWVTGGVLAMLVSGVVAYRSARSVVPASNPAEHPSEPRWYFHERPLALGLITAAALFHNLPLFLVGYLDPIGALWLAVLLFCLGGWWRRWRNEPRAQPQWNVNPGELAAVWLATAVTLFTAIPTLALFAFIASIFGPWIDWRLFE